MSRPPSYAETFKTSQLAINLPMMKALLHYMLTGIKDDKYDDLVYDHCILEDERTGRKFVATQAMLEKIISRLEPEARYNLNFAQDATLKQKVAVVEEMVNSGQIGSIEGLNRIKLLRSTNNIAKRGF